MLSFFAARNPFKKPFSVPALLVLAITWIVAIVVSVWILTE
jgi:hypothetical protein